MVVIAISGVSGSGKTSVIKQLSKKLTYPYLLFDDYVEQDTYPKDMKAWYGSGADLSAIQTPSFYQAILNLKSDSDKQCVLIEEPFGRERELISSLIDYVILLDPPMEVCLSRVIARNINHTKTDSLISIPKYLSMYDDYFREIYLAVNNQVRSNCDLVINEIASSELIVETISQWLDINELSSTRNTTLNNQFNTKMEF